LHGRVAFTKAGYVLALMSEYSLFEVVVGRRQTKKFVCLGVGAVKSK